MSPQAEQGCTGKYPQGTASSATPRVTKARLGRPVGPDGGGLCVLPRGLAFPEQQPWEGLEHKSL